MVVGGGCQPNAGGIYDPTTDTGESATSTGGLCPTARGQHSGVGTGPRMFAGGGYDEVVPLGDGTARRPAGAPFDAIVVTAGGPEVPQPLLAQLAPGGCLVGPFGARERQKLIRMRCEGHGNFSREELGPCRFVELLGMHGWAAA